jgi:hypothetical protein
MPKTQFNPRNRRPRKPRLTITPSNEQLYRFVKKSQQQFAVYDWSIPSHTGDYVTLSNLSDYTDLASLFDQYRIDRVEYQFIYSQTMSPAAIPGANLAPMPILYTVIDYDDASALSTTDQYLHYRSCKVSRLDKIVTLSLVPKLANGVYNGSFGGYGSCRQFVDSASPTVQWYGVKYCIDPQVYGTGSNKIGELLLIKTFHLTLRYADT